MRAIALIIVALLAAGAAFRHSLQPTTLQPAAAQPADPLAPLEFLTGAWRSQDDGQTIDETWSDARGGQILGMFRWLDAGHRITVLELLAISREADRTFLRLRHFDAAMKPWPSEADSPITLALDRQAPGLAQFRAIDGERRLAAVRYESPDPSRLTITVEFPPDPPRAPFIITLARLPSP
jgi:hypothetical protein